MKTQEQIGQAIRILQDRREMLGITIKALDAGEIPAPMVYTLEIKDLKTELVKVDAQVNALLWCECKNFTSSVWLDNGSM